MKKTTQKGIFSIVAGWDRKEIESSEAMYQIFQLLFNDKESKFIYRLFILIYTESK